MLQRDLSLVIMVSGGIFRFKYIPDKKKETHTVTFSRLVYLFGLSCLNNKIVTNYRFVTKLQCNINKYQHFYLA